MNMTDLTVLEAPFEFPEDLALSPLLQRLIMGEKAWITGSYPLSLLYPFEPNDIDVFCHDATAPTILRLLEVSGYERDETDFSPDRIHYTNGQLSMKFNHESQPPINILIGKFECIQDVWAGFDLSCCEIAVVWDEEENDLCLVGSDKFQETVETGVVSCSAASRGATAFPRRVWKYADRGWTSFQTDGLDWTVAISDAGYIGTYSEGNWGVAIDNLPPLTPKD